jgi:hypothetical protein
MFRGTVTFRARIKGNGLTFPLLEFNPHEPGVDRVEVEGPHGDEIVSSVHLASVVGGLVALAKRSIELHS